MRMLQRDPAMFRRAAPGLVPALALLLLFVSAGVTAWIVSYPAQDHRFVAPADLARRADRPTGIIAPERTIAADPVELTPLSTDQAVLRNAAIPVVPGAVAAAPPFSLGRASAVDVGRALDCLTAAIYYEAATEPIQGQRAVAQVVLNRVRHPAYPNTVCGVVFQGANRRTGCQFTFACDGSLARNPIARRWAIAQGVASAALSGVVEPSVGMATHYHANYVLPVWSPQLTKLAVVGVHIFLRWQGSWGERSAFSQVYRGAEPDIDWRHVFAVPAPAATDAPGALGSPSADVRPVLTQARPPLAMDSPARDVEAGAVAGVGDRPALVGADQRWILNGGPSLATPRPVITAAPAPKASPAP